MLLRHAEAHEPVRRVVATALRDGSALEQPNRRHERRVEDRDGEDEDRQEERCDGRPSDVPARCETERGECEPEHLRAGVAHEDERLLARAKVERQEARAGARAGEGEGQVSIVWMDGDSVDCEEAKRDPGERRGETVHVVEQVERVRRFRRARRSRAATRRRACGSAARRCRSRGRSPPPRSGARASASARARAGRRPGPRRTAARCLRRCRRSGCLPGSRLPGLPPRSRRSARRRCRRRRRAGSGRRGAAARSRERPPVAAAAPSRAGA